MALSTAIRFSALDFSGSFLVMLGVAVEHLVLNGERIALPCALSGLRSSCLLLHTTSTGAAEPRREERDAIARGVDCCDEFFVCCLCRTNMLL